MTFFDFEAIRGQILPCDDFTPYLTIPAEKRHYPSPDSPRGQNVIAEAESCLTKPLPILPVSLYRLFVENGNRSQFEALYFERREMLDALVSAELCENKGRFTDKALDVLFAILEESTWVLPAHNRSRENHPNSTIVPIPENDDENIWTVDLFSAETAQIVATSYRLMREKFAEKLGGAITILDERVEKTLIRRVIKPYLTTTDQWWMGYTSHSINNWNPWINKNILTAAAFFLHNDSMREEVVRKTIEGINFYVDTLPTDGACDEGPGYWNVAGLCVYGFAEMLYEISGGVYNVFGNDFLHKIMRYIPMVHIAGDRYFNCADAHAYQHPNGSAIRRYARLAGDEMLFAFGNDIITRHPPIPGKYLSSEYVHDFVDNEPEDGHPFKAPETAHLPDLQFAALRESDDASRGFYLGVKGGHNAENHNHLDVGNFILYNNGEPCVIDPGVGTYTKFTFLPETRYTMFAFRTEDHNLPLIGGAGQGIGRDYHSDSFSFDGEHKTVSVGLRSAYMCREDLEDYTRTLSLNDGIVTVTDTIRAKAPLPVSFRYQLTDEPKMSDDHTLLLGGGVQLTVPDGFSAEIVKNKPDDDKFCREWERESLWQLRITPHRESVSYCLTLTFRHS